MPGSIEDAVATLEQVELEVRKAQLTVSDLSEAAQHLQNAREKLATLINEIEPLKGALSDNHANSIEIVARVLAGIYIPAELRGQAQAWAASLRGLL